MDRTERPSAVGGWTEYPVIGTTAHTARHAVKCAEWCRTQDVAWRSSPRTGPASLATSVSRAYSTGHRQVARRRPPGPRQVGQMEPEAPAPDGSCFPSASPSEPGPRNSSAGGPGPLEQPGTDKPSFERVHSQNPLPNHTRKGHSPHVKHLLRTLTAPRSQPRAGRFRNCSQFVSDRSLLCTGKTRCP